MRVQHVNCCVSIQVQHLIKVEPAWGSSSHRSPVSRQTAISWIFSRKERIDNAVSALQHACTNLNWPLHLHKSESFERPTWPGHASEKGACTFGQDMHEVDLQAQAWSAADRSAKIYISRERMGVGLACSLFCGCSSSLHI